MNKYENKKFNFYILGKFQMSICVFVYSTLVFSFIGHMKFDLYVSPLSKKKTICFP